MGGNEASKTNKCTAACPPPSPSPRGCKQPRRLSGRGRSRGLTIWRTRRRGCKRSHQLYRNCQRVCRSRLLIQFSRLYPRRSSDPAGYRLGDTPCRGPRRAPGRGGRRRRTREAQEAAEIAAKVRAGYPSAAAGVLMEFRTMNVVYLRFCDGILVVR